MFFRTYFFSSLGSGVPRKKGCNSPLLPATASDSRVISSRIQDPPAAVVEGDSQKGGGDDDDVRNELELRNGLDGKGQTWGLWRYIACEKWLNSTRLFRPGLGSKCFFSL